MSYSMIVIVPAADKLDAIEMAAYVLGDAKLFHVGLSAAGTNPPTHWVAAASPDSVQWMILLKELPLFPNAIFFQIAANGELAFSNSGMNLRMPFNFDEALDFLGLQKIEGENETT